MHRLTPMDEEALYRIHRHINSDFSAIVLLTEPGGRLRVISSIGSRSERTGKLAFRPNQGIAQHVFKYGRSYMIDEASMDRTGLLKTCPLLLAERLSSIIAVPILQHKLPIGLIVTGRRSNFTFSSQDIECAKHEAEAISQSVDALSPLSPR
ncbi:GAF domain-containing protein [Neobacillus mesonae]|nr:GAF domain-containing protein [Neobacillus mesonae]